MNLLLLKYSCSHSSLKGSCAPQSCHLRWVSCLNLFYRMQKVWHPHVFIIAFSIFLKLKIPSKMFPLEFKFAYIWCCNTLYCFNLTWTNNAWNMSFQQPLCFQVVLNVLSDLQWDNSASGMMGNISIILNACMASVITRGGMWSLV